MWEVQAGWFTGSSTSSGEEDRKSKSLEAENKDLRARLEALGRKEGEEPKEDKAFHPGEEAAWRRSGDWTWTLRMWSRVAKNG